MANGDAPVIDRSKLTYKESKRASLLGMIVQRAQIDLDIEAMEHAFEELDQLVMKVVVSVPDGWLPDGVTLDTPGWIDHLSQANAKQLISGIRMDVPGEKKA